MLQKNLGAVTYSREALPVLTEPRLYRVRQWPGDASIFATCSFGLIMEVLEVER